MIGLLTESTNLTSGTSTPVNPSLSPRFGGRPVTYKKTPSLSQGKGSSGTLGSRRKHVTSSSSMTSSASSDNCCHSDVTYPEVETRDRDRRKDIVEGTAVVTITRANHQCLNILYFECNRTTR